MAGWIGAVLCGLMAALTADAAQAQETSAQARGEYIFRAAGGCGCHTDVKGGGDFLAGGRPLETPFGIFYSPNITPDRDSGIGAWSDADFARAMSEGVAPDGSDYFPVFPYTAFTGMTAADLADLKAYLDTVPAIARTNRSHEVAAPYRWRFMVGPWKWLFFEPGPYRPRADRTGRWNRGAYLATALAHCAECHTPRNAMGALMRDMLFAGAARGPEGQRAPNITPHAGTGIGRWSAAELIDLLKTGLKPDFDDVQGLMSEAVEQGYKYMSDEDLAAIADYVLSLPAIDNLVPSKSAASQSEFD